ncbi:MAG: antitoxin YezG family protein [Ruminococcus sp.]|nr:antitoxin YezG family protein [Ruminococcus sp.]
MNDISYQNIFSILEKILPANWNRIILYVRYAEISYSVACYVDMGNGRYIDCFNIPEISDDELNNAYSEIDSEIYYKRRELPKEKKWYVMTMKVNSNGAFSVEYDYNDVSDYFIEHFMEWKKKYLES